MARKRRFSTTRAAGMIHVDVNDAGVAQASAVLLALPQAIRNAILVPIVRIVVQKGAQIAKQNLVRVLPNRAGQKKRWDRPTGALRDSLGAKVMPTGKMRNKGIVYGIYGARLDFRVLRSTARNIAAIRKKRLIPITTKKGHNMWVLREYAGPQGVARSRMANGKLKATRGSIQPTKYIHLVERGHREVVASSLKTGNTWRIPAARPYPFMGPTRTTITGMIPGIIREHFNRLLPLVVARERRRAERRINTASGQVVL